MARGIMSVNGLGTVGRDGEVKQTSAGPVLEFSIAVNDKTKAGESTAWYRVSMFGRRGEVLAPMIHKGDTVYVSGKLVPREYQGKDGKAMSLDIRAQEIELAGGKRDAEPQRAAQFSRAPGVDDLGGQPFEPTDDLPF